MTERHEFIRAAHERAALMKIMNVKRDGTGSAMPFVVDGSRGSQHVATFFPTKAQSMIRAMRLAVSAFGCDLVAGSADTYQVHGDVSTAAYWQVNPDTDQAWGPGDLRRAFEADRPWVREGLSTHAVDRVEQQVYMMGQTYQLQGSRIVWDPLRGPFTDGADYCATGAVPDALRDSLRAPDVLAEMNHRAGPSGCALTRAERRAYTDVAALRVCAQLDIAVVYDVTDPEVRDTVEALLLLDAPLTGGPAQGRPG